MNQETLTQRLQTQIEKLYGTKLSQQLDSSINSTSKTMPSSLHAWSNGCLAEPTFQNLAGPIFHEPIVSPDECSSITTCTDNFSVSGSASNLESSSKSRNSHFLQQHVDDCMF